MLAVLSAVSPLSLATCPQVRQACASVHMFLHFQIQPVTLAWDALLLCPPPLPSLPLPPPSFLFSFLSSSLFPFSLSFFFFSLSFSFLSSFVPNTAISLDARPSPLTVLLTSTKSQRFHFQFLFHVSKGTKLYRSAAMRRASTFDLQDNAVPANAFKAKENWLAYGKTKQCIH